MNSGAAMACAVAGAATMLNGHSAAQSYVAADYATNSIYNSGWSAGQNGGYGFGAWSFDTSDPSGGLCQSMSTASALGTAWTLFTTNQPDATGIFGGLANAGRAILEPGGLQVGQTFQAIIQNPVTYAGQFNVYNYRGFDILFTSASDNNPPGDNTAALRVQVFDYRNPAMHWHINDMFSESTTVSGTNTGTSGMIIALTLDSTNTYTFSMAPVSDPNSPYLTQSGTLGTNLPINYFNFRNWNTTSSDTNDVANNFEISSMTIFGTMLNIQPAGTNTVLSWSTNVPNFVLASSPSLNAGGVWTTNLPAPTVIGNQNFVTNPISGPQQFYRLQLAQ
jgi:hypothetical protein